AISLERSASHQETIHEEATRSALFVLFGVVSWIVPGNPREPRNENKPCMAFDYVRTLRSLRVRIFSHHMTIEGATTLGELKASDFKSVSVKDELRANLICKLKRHERLFPGIVGYD